MSLYSAKAFYKFEQPLKTSLIQKDTLNVIKGIHQIQQQISF